MLNSLQVKNSGRTTSAIETVYKFQNIALTCLANIVTYMVAKACISQDEVMLINEEIKRAIIAIFDLWLLKAC